MKFMKCQQVQGRLLLFLEGELEPREATAVGEHLRECPRCGARAEELAETQEQVEAALRTDISAPPTLEPRVMATVRRLPMRRLQWPAFTPPWSWQRQLNTVGTALCLVLVGFLGGRVPRRDFRTLRVPAPPPRDSVAVQPAPQILELTSLRDDHLQSLTNPRAVTVMGNDPRQVAQRLGKQGDCVVVPVKLAASGAQLLGGRWHHVAGVPVAFLCYAWEGQRVSLYQADERRLTLPALRALEQHRATHSERCYVVEQSGSLTYMAWCSGMTNYILVAQAAPERLLQLAERATITTRAA